jgi:4-hydroxybenzoate polyprenyltransferase
VIVGAAAVSGGVPLPAFLAYLAGVAWTLGYDTIYALQDIEDDALAGVKSSARRLGRRARAGVALFYALAVLLAAAALLLCDAGASALLLAPVAIHLAWQVLRLDPDDPARCLALFRSNVWTGGLFALAFLAA